MVHDHRTKLLLLVVGELLVLAEVVERLHRAGRNQGASALTHAGLGPFGEAHEPEPEGVVDAVVIEALDALEHDDVRRRPRPEALAEDHDFGTVLLGDRLEAHLHTPEQTAELRSPEVDLLHLEERRASAVLDACGGDVSAGV